MKTRPYATAEQYERWFMCTCARCGRRAEKAAVWPDGPICLTCYTRAIDTYGNCPACCAHRLLPGRVPDGSALCRDCAGIKTEFLCSRCQHEGRLHARKLCTSCTIADELDALLEDGTGRINPELVPFAERILSMPKPVNRLAWLRKPRIRTLLTDLATGTLPLTHDALHEHPDWRIVANLRDLLMSCEVLPLVDKQLLHAESRLRRQLAEVEHEPHRHLLQQFVHWHLIPDLHAKARRYSLTESARKCTNAQFTCANNFMRWLDEHHTRLANTTQADLENWHAGHRTHAIRSLRPFLRWATDRNHMPRLCCI